VTHDALVDLTINNHYETIKLHCITIGNLPIIVGLPWLRKHNPNIDWKEGRVTFDSAKYAKECLVTSPHAVTVAKEKAIGEYYRDTVQAAAFQDRVCSTSMLEEEEVRLTLKASKCEFHTNNIEYLGYIISPTGIEMDPEKVRAVAEWKEPTNVKGVQSFLGFANFYRRFIRDFSKIMAPLTRLIQKDTPWGWDDDALVSFEELKRAILSEPIL
jgi:hypothetical protein